MKKQKLPPTLYDLYDIKPENDGLCGAKEIAEYWNRISGDTRHHDNIISFLLSRRAPITQRGKKWYAKKTELLFFRDGQKFDRVFQFEE